jgi:hypothetical protein
MALARAGGPGHSLDRTAAVLPQAFALSHPYSGDDGRAHLGGREAAYEESGNAHHITIGPDSVLIEGLFEDVKCEVPLDDFERAVSEWLAGLCAERRSP